MWSLERFAHCVFDFLAFNLTVLKTSNNTVQNRSHCEISKDSPQGSSLLLRDLVFLSTLGKFSVRGLFCEEDNIFFFQIPPRSSLC